MSAYLKSYLILLQIRPIGFCNGAKKNEWGLSSAFQKVLLEPKDSNLDF